MIVDEQQEDSASVQPMITDMNEEQSLLEDQQHENRDVTTLSTFQCCGHKGLWNKLIKDETPRGIQYCKSFKASMAENPFKTDMGEGPDSLHESVRHCLAISKATGLTLKEWEQFFIKAFTAIFVKVSPDGPGIRKIAFRLMWTDPHTIFDSHMWQEQCLRDRNDTRAWTAIYKLCGAKWKSKSKYNSFQQIALRPHCPLLHNSATLHLRAQL